MGDGQGSLASLLARGPQDSFMTGGDGLIPEFLQYSDYSIDQRTYTFGTAPYLGTRQVFTTTPKQIPGDLLIGAYLKLQLPSATYMNQVGRGITKRVSMQLDAVEVETLYDDGYFIRDQLLLNNDEQSLMSNLMNGTSLYIPLDFSWCRGGSPFPICSAWNQKLYIFIDFAAMYEISSTNSGDLLVPPQIVLETVTISETERAKYMQYTMNVNHMYREPLYFINNQLTNVNLSANFNVNHMTWFIRKRLDFGDPTYYLKRFNFTYDTTTNVALTNTDLFEYIYIFLNNQNITSRFPGKLFYKYLQPTLHGLTTPSQDIYMYSFGTTGLDFTKVNSNTSTLNIKFLSQYVQDVILNYTLNLYYFGTQKISFSGGYCSLLSV